MILHQTNMPKIRVLNKQTGQTGTVSEEFFDPNKYEKINSGSQDQVITPQIPAQERTPIPVTSGASSRVSGMQKNYNPPVDLSKFMTGARENAQTIGTVVGGMAAGIPGAALGSGAGYATQNISEQVPALEDYIKSGTYKNIKPTPQSIFSNLSEFNTGLKKSMLQGGAAQVAGNVISGAGSKLTNLLLSKIPKGMMQSALSFTKSAARREIGMGEDLAQQSLEKGTTGGVGKLIKEGKSTIKTVGKKIDNFLSQHSTDKHSLVDIVSKALKDRVAEISKIDKSKAKIMEDVGQEIIENNKWVANPSELNKIKSLLDNEVKGTFGKAIDDISASKKEAQRLISDAIRGTLRSTYKEISPLLDEQHYWYGIIDAMNEIKAGRISTGLIPSTMLGALSQVMRLIRSPELMTPISTAMYKSGKVISPIVKATKVPITAGVSKLEEFLKGKK